MIATIFCALLGIAVGVAVTSATPPRSAFNTFGPLIVVVIVAAIIGRS